MASSAKTLRSAQHDVRPSLAHVVKGAEGLVAFARHAGGSALDRLQLKLKVLQLRLDPETKRWADESRKAIANGDTAAAIAAQPRPRELAAQVRDQRS